MSYCLTLLDYDSIPSADLCIIVALLLQLKVAENQLVHYDQGEGGKL